MFKDEFGLYPIAVIEHHLLAQTDKVNLSTYDICKNLNELWGSLRKEEREEKQLIDVDFILKINGLVAESLNITPRKTFKDAQAWDNVIETETQEFSISEDKYHWRCWMFSELYWNQLETLKISTCWFFYNVFNLTYGLPEEWLVMGKIGDFLDSLSGSGPPLFDGQTFYPEEYCGK
ncbi:hypothetical protein FUAX_27480 [Fulvitalea axinellae]|uniref:Uncharacterized protein n=1 Tax=Fulvitalea axinellae TaxID=1182444 RepID=A0AAU9DB51_9BACT|nr:hypothetical protein FUAX_27480 [Fulvitalea axinellae]